MTLPNPLPLPLCKSIDRSQMPAHAVRLIDGGRDLVSQSTVDLMTALIKLPPHPLERMQSSARFGEAVQRTAQDADTTLSVVAAQVQRQRRGGEIKPSTAFAATCDVPGGGTCRCRIRRPTRRDFQNPLTMQ